MLSDAQKSLLLQYTIQLQVVMKMSPKINVDVLIFSVSGCDHRWNKVLADIVKIRSGSRMGFYSTTDVNTRGKSGCTLRRGKTATW